MEEADILFDYVKANLQTTPKGEVHLTKEKCPENFDESFTRVSFRDTYLCTTEGLQIVAQLSSEEYSIYDPTYVKNGHLDIHLAIDDCHEMTSKALVDKVPKLLRYARQLSSKLSTYEEDGEPGSVPPEILARGPKAQTAYKEALKKGKVKNYRVPVVLVGQARSGKTSLLRSLNGENFNSEEDSTVGVKLQRSLSKPEGSEWDVQDGSKENMMHNHCLSIKIVERLLGNPAKHIQEDVDRHESDEYEEIDRSANSRQESDHTNHKSSANRSEEEPLQAQKTTKMGKKEDAETNKFANVDIQTRQVLQPTQLTDEVATYTANLLGKPDVKGEIEDYLFFDTMDFAGQPVYSATHPVFLPPKGIYLLTHSLKTDINDKAVAIVRSGAAERKVDVNNPLTNLDHLKIWLSLIAANSTQKGCSPVFLVSTHADNFSEADAKQTSRKILEAVKEKDFLPGQNAECEIYPVDNTVSGKAGVRDPSIEKLKKHLRDKVKELPQCNEDIPVRWFLFEKELNRLVQKEGKKELSTEDVKSIAIQCGVDTSTDEPDTLLNYLHDLKVIIYFPEANAIIIDTQWLLDMFAKVITVQPIECHKGYEDEWRRLEKDGVVDIPFLNHLWKDLLNDDTSVESLITIMEKFSLVCKVKDESLLVPAMLPNSDFDELWNEFTEKDNLLSPLIIKFESSHLPFGMFPRLLARVDKMCNLEWERSHVSGNFARFYKNDDDFSMIFISDTTTISAVLSVDDENENLCSTSNENYNHQCEWIVQFLRKTLEEMFKSFSWMKTLKFNFCVRCPICLDSASKMCKKHNKENCRRDSCVHLIPEKELTKSTKPRCEKNDNKRNNVIPAKYYLHWFPKLNKKPPSHTAVIPATSCSTNVFRSPLTSSKDKQSMEIIPLLQEVSFPTISPGEAAEKAKEIAAYFKLDKNCMQDPPDNFRKQCQYVYRVLIEGGMKEVLKAFRSELPCGVTGPIQYVPNLLVKDMDLKGKEEFARALTIRKTEWKTFAKDQVGLSGDTIEFLDDREPNPVLDILKTHCGNWTMDRLYNALVESGACGTVDSYL